MSHEVRVRLEALEEARYASGWYEQQAEGLGRRFLLEFERAAARMSEHPARYPLVPRVDSEWHRPVSFLDVAV